MFSTQSDSITESMFYKFAFSVLGSIQTITDISFVTFFPFQQTYQTATKTITETRTANGYNGSLPRSTTPHQNSLPRSSTPQRLQASTSGNLSELDSLLQDLSSARYGNIMEKRKSSRISNYAAVVDCLFLLFVLRRSSQQWNN